MFDALSKDASNALLTQIFKEQPKMAKLNVLHSLSFDI